MRYKDSLDYEEKNHYDLADEFISNHQDEYNEFAEERYQSELENDFIDEDELYEQFKLDEIE